MCLTGADSATLVSPPDVQDAVDNIARVLEPEAWEEYDAGNGICSNQAGWRCTESLNAAKRILKAWPAIGDIVNPGLGVTDAINEMKSVLAQRMP